MNMRVRSSASVAALTAFFALGTVGCSTWEGMGNRERGAVIGAGGGAVAGGVIGHQVGNTAAGAIIGAAVGGAAGAIIGHQMDQQAKEMDDIAGAEVQRVGEGIVVTFDSGILFDFDSDALRSNARANLSELAASLQRHPDTEVLIVGHTDAVGSDDYNMNLSYRRANSAAQYLQTQGVSSARVETAGRGETEPIASNDSEAGRQENRRVEIAIFASEEMQDEARAAAARQ
ncbi:MAG TPA: OmpA family protein [Longimicrobiales bacterium]|nr:OmpA family protein [Longimicrobiales bacterium]